MRVTLDAYAKINLYLDIVGKRENGYHDIKGIMHKISLCDTVSVDVEKSDKNVISLTCSVDGIPTDRTNIAYKAAEFYLERYTTDTYSVAIHIEKRIPAAGGLAGGSTDGAAVLRALHSIIGKVEYEVLITDSAQLGADIPFCMVDSAMITEGIGDRLTPCPSLPECAILICNTGEGVSTPLAYRKLDEIYDDFKDAEFDSDRFSTLTKGLELGDIALISRGMFNIFEKAVLTECPLAREVKDIMAELGAAGVMMSGSGSTIFGIFKDENEAKCSYDKLSALGYVTHICKNSK